MRDPNFFLRLERDFQKFQGNICLEPVESPEDRLLCIVHHLLALLCTIQIVRVSHILI